MYKCVSAIITAEAYISTAWRRRSLVLFGFSKHGCDYVCVRAAKVQQTVVFNKKYTRWRTFFIICVTFQQARPSVDWRSSSSSSSRAGPWWSIAASMVRCHCSLSWARLHAVCRPMLSALRSFSMVHVHDCLGRPGGRLQWLSNPEITVRSALEWSIHASDLATSLKSRRRHWLAGYDHRKQIQ